MAIKPQCDFCARELKSFGAILLSPPDKKGDIRKYHICKVCYSELAKKYTLPK